MYGKIYKSIAVRTDVLVLPFHKAYVQYVIVHLNVYLCKYVFVHVISVYSCIYIECVYIYMYIYLYTYI